MNMRNKYLTIIAAFVCILLSSCSNDENYFDDSTPTGSSQLISQDIVFETDSAKNEESITTRGIDNNGFTNEYPYEYIYVHSTTDETKTLKVPLKEVEYCDGCRGIHLEMEINENGDGSYTLRTEPGKDGQAEEITLSANEEVYFSSYPTNTWTANKLDNVSTPITQQDVFIGDDNINIELLKSDAYGKDDLITLLTTPKPEIKLKRHCTGFMVSFMFTNVDENHGGDNVNNPGYSVTQYTWEKYLSGTTPDDFYLKLYIGPNFCHTYDIYNNEVPDDDKGGYYVINNNQYAQLTGFTAIAGGLYEGFSATGCGYNTSMEDILLAPLNTSMDLSNFAIYAFVKYAPNGTDVDSDDGSFYLKIPLNEDVTTAINCIHKFVLCVDINKLKEVIEKTNATNTLTRGLWNKPEELEIQPAEVICIQE